MTKEVITIMLSIVLVKEIRKIQSKKIRKTIKSVSLSGVIEQCITSKKKFYIKGSAHNKVRITIMMDSKTLKKLRCIQSDKQAKSKKTVSLSWVIEDHLLMDKKS